jgi:hypothetical protein
MVRRRRAISRGPTVENASSFARPYYPRSVRGKYTCQRAHPLSTVGPWEIHPSTRPPIIHGRSVGNVPATPTHDNLGCIYIYYDLPDRSPKLPTLTVRGKCKATGIQCVYRPSFVASQDVGSATEWDPVIPAERLGALGPCYSLRRKVANSLAKNLKIQKFSQSTYRLHTSRFIVVLLKYRHVTIEPLRTYLRASFDRL